MESPEEPQHLQGKQKLKEQRQVEEDGVNEENQKMKHRTGEETREEKEEEGEEVAERGLEQSQTEEKRGGCQEEEGEGKRGQTCQSGSPSPLICRQPGVVGGDLFVKENEPVLPVDADDVEREKRLEELRQRNTQFWRKIFVESGVREEEPKREENVWKQRLTIVAVIAVVAAGISQALYRAYVDVHFGFKYIDVKDTERLKEVMFGGHPWIVLCRWPEGKSNVPEILNRHRRELMSFGNLGSVDCSAQLPSGKTFSERFRIPSSTDAIVVTNGKTPRALNAWTLKTWENLSFFLQKSTRVDVTKVEDNISFTKSCLYPPGARCVAFLRKGGFSADRRKAISSALAQKGSTRKLKAITIDSAKYQIVRTDIPTEPAYATRVACFGNISPPPLPETKKTNDVSNNIFIFSLYEGDFTDTPALSSFAEKCIQSKEGSEGFAVLPQVPALKRRPFSSTSSDDL